MNTFRTLATVSRQLNRAAPGRALPPLIFLTDCARVPDPAALIAGWPRSLARRTLVIFRHYDAKDRPSLAKALARLCRARGVLLSIAADPALARAVGAAGVHWPDAFLRGRQRLPRLRPDLIQTVAAHDLAGLARAARCGAHAALLSPVFATDSHVGTEPLGAVRFTRLVRLATLPVYALGGVSATTAPRLLGSGAVGLAAIGAFLPDSPPT